MTHPALPTLAAVLIMRDEEAALPACLEAVAGVVDVVHVHDTGSTDGTVQIARAAGAVISAGPWTGDFAAARNDALAGCDATWVLSLDADERLVADDARLRRLLSSTAYDVLTVEVDNRHDELPYTHRAARLFRPDVVRWTGRVHEQLAGPRGLHPAGTAPRECLRLDHEGYADAGVRRAKSVRNAGLAQQELDALAGAAGAADPRHVARTLLDLGRSMVGAGRTQDAVDTFETLRDLFPATPEWAQATDALARLVLGAGLDDVALALADQLRGVGAPPSYCDWISAQALAQLGDVPGAWALLEGVHEVVDTSGRRYAPGHLAELKALVGALRPAS